MAFVSIYVPGFMVQAVMRGEPGLRRHPVALVDGTPPLWSVVAASEDALQAGIELGMAKSQASQFCAVQIRHRSRAQEKAAHAALLDLGWSISPRIEDSAPDTIVLDLAGLASLFGSEEKIAHELAGRASSLGLVTRIAVASNPEAAILAARGFPGITLIAPGEEAQRLGCLPVSALLPSVEVLEIFERWGVRTCAALASLPVLELSERLGQDGVRLHELARGARLRSLVLAEPDLCFEEEMALEYALAELEPLAFLLGRLLDQLCARLAARSLAARAIRLRFDLELSFEKELQPPGEKPGAKPAPKKTASDTYEKILNLPVPMRDSKMLLKLVRLRLESDPPPAPILKILMGVEPAPPRVVQGGLFLRSSPDPEKLELTIARLANLVGNSNVGAPQLVDTHRPGEFRMDRFLPLRDGEMKNTLQHFHSLTHQRSAAPATAFRIFRPPLPARVELRDGRPARVSFRGLRGAVVAASGPWRTSGDWWREDPWEHDEWDLDIHFGSPGWELPAQRESLRQRSTAFQAVPHRRKACATEPVSGPQRGLYRIYYDSIRQGWFVRGIYD